MSVGGILQYMQNTDTPPGGLPSSSVPPPAMVTVTPALVRVHRVVPVTTPALMRSAANEDGNRGRLGQLINNLEINRATTPQRPAKAVQAQERVPARVERRISSASSSSCSSSSSSSSGRRVTEVIDMTDSPDVIYSAPFSGGGVAAATKSPPASVGATSLPGGTVGARFIVVKEHLRKIYENPLLERMRNGEKWNGEKGKVYKFITITGRYRVSFTLTNIFITVTLENSGISSSNPLARPSMLAGLNSDMIRNKVLKEKSIALTKALEAAWAETLIRKCFRSIHLHFTSCL